MRTPTRLNAASSALFVVLVLAFAAAGLMLGCDSAAERDNGRPPDKGGKNDKLAASKKQRLGKNVFFEMLPNKKRRVLVNAEVCLRKGQLELLLCRKHTKEHEAILAADVDARIIHAALNAAGAKEGSPVRWAPKYRPASGTTIKVFLRYTDKGKQVTVSAQSWIKNAKTNKLLESDWVFGGSHLVANPLNPDGPKQSLANDGDLVCVSNFETALLDLPIKSPKDNADLIFVANTERIPPLETKVVVLLEPVVQAKKEKK